MLLFQGTLFENHLYRGVTEMGWEKLGRFSRTSHSFTGLCTLTKLSSFAEEYSK